MKKIATLAGMRIFSWVAFLTACASFIITLVLVGANYFFKQVSLDELLPAFSVEYADIRIAPQGNRFYISQLAIANKLQNPLLTADEVVIFNQTDKRQIHLLNTTIHLDSLRNLTAQELTKELLPALQEVTTRANPHVDSAPTTQPASDDAADKKPIIVLSQQTNFRSEQLPFSFTQTNITLQYHNGTTHIRASNDSNPFMLSVFAAISPQGQTSLHVTLSNWENPALTFPLLPLAWQDHNAHLNAFYDNTANTLSFHASGDAQEPSVLQHNAAAAQWQVYGHINTQQPQHWTLTTALNLNALPIPATEEIFETVSVYGEWHQQGEDWQYVSDYMTFANEELTAYIAAAAAGQRNTAGIPTATHALIYGNVLPVSLTVLSDYLTGTPDVHKWYSNAVIDGIATQLNFSYVLQPNENTPTTDIGISVAFDDGALRLDDGWQTARGLDGTFVLQGDEINIVGSGSYGKLRARQVSVRINNLYDSISTLFLDARSAQAGIADFIYTAQRTAPIRQQVTDYLEGVDLRGGSGQLSLALAMPLPDLAATKVTAQLAARGMTLSVSPIAPLTHINATLQFSENNFSGQANGRMNQRSAAPFTAILNNDTITARGVMTASDLWTAAQLPHYPKHSAIGFLDYTFSQTPLQQNFIGDLTDIEIDFPAPLQKESGAAATLDITIEESQLQAALHLPSLRVNILNNDDGIDIALNQNNNPPRRAGGMLHGNAAQVNIDDWLALNDDNNESESKTAAADSTDTNSNTAAAPAAPSHINLTLRQATFLNTENEFFIAQVNPLDNEAQAIRLSATNIGGDITVRDNNISGRFTHFNLVDTTTTTLTATLAAVDSINAAAITASVDASVTLATITTTAPNLSLHFDSIAYNSLTLGSAHLLTEQTEDTYQVRQFEIINTQSTLALAGTFEQSFSYLTVYLDSSNAAEILEIFKVSNFITEAQVSVFGALSWAGSFRQFERAALRGRIRMLATEVAYTDLDFGSGIVNFLSLFSPLSLLELGFTELTNPDKLFFNQVSGDITLKDGLAITEDITMDSDDVNVQLAGTSNYINRTHNLSGTVRPGKKLVEAGSTVGLGTGLAALEPTTFLIGTVLGKVFEDPISQIGSYNYTITGTWDEPLYKETTPTQPTTNEAGQ